MYRNMKTKWMVAASFMAALVMTTACGNANKQSKEETVTATVSAALSKGVRTKCVRLDN